MKNENDIGEKVIQSLDLALTPCLIDPKISFGDWAQHVEVASSVKYYPNGLDLPKIMYYGQRYVFYAVRVCFLYILKFLSP